jgi:coenzyme F420-reducing hydrogenase alpha subunit
MDAQMIQSHVLHLYFLVAPDYLGLDSGLEIIKTHPVYFQQALELKRVSDLIADTVGGRGIHPTSTAAGGFHIVPSIEKLKTLGKEAEKMLDAAESCVHLFNSLNYPEVKTDLALFALTSGNNYEIYNIKNISSNKKLKAKSADYEKIIKEEIKPYSTAKFGYHAGKGMMVGSLARLNLQGSLLKGKAKEFFREASLDFQNPYHNNLAQAIETYQFVHEANEILNVLIENGIDDKATKLPTKLKVGKNLAGVGALEAPRGSLYYEVSIDTYGLISACNIITPTVQNLSSMEETAQAVLDQMKGQPKEKIQEYLEMLIRAYDPCITCSVH